MCDRTETPADAQCGLLEVGRLQRGRGFAVEASGLRLVLTEQLELAAHHPRTGLVADRLGQRVALVDLGQHALGLLEVALPEMSAGEDELRRPELLDVIDT